MKISRTNLVLFSPCGGSKKAVEAVARAMPAPRVHDLTLPANRPQSLSFNSEDLVIFGFPVYGGRLPAISEKLFSTISGRQTPAVLVAVYGNREYEGAFLDMEAMSRARGFRPVAAAAAIAEHSIEPSIAAGRPDAADQGALADFGRRVYERLLAQPDLEAFAFEAPGVRPDREPSGSSGPQADTELCIKCGQCVGVCPVSAIDQQDPTITTDQCIGCMACVKVCPVSARALRRSDLPQLLEWLKSVTAERKEPTFFY